MDLAALFLTLGFNENEQRVYLDLADVGKSTASMVAKRVGIPRTTAYSVLDNLEGKGVVSLEHKGSTTFYKVNQPEALMRMLRRDREELSRKEESAKLLVDLVKPLFRSKNFSVPKLQFYEGSENVENMLYQNTSAWSETIMQTDGVWWGYQDYTFVEHHMAYIEWFWKTCPKELKLKLLSNEAEIERGLSERFERREIRYLPEEYHFNSSLWVLGDYLILFRTREEPHYAFQICDSVLAESLRKIFQLLWKLAR
jgi:sugar-specific transcriptional regulator TrmB